MKRDTEKIKRIKECIKKFYSSVSDKRVADKFGVSVRSIADMRRRMKLNKLKDVSVKLSKKAKKKINII